MSNRASPDTLVRTGKQGKIELEEEDLKRVAGGAVAGKLDYTTTTKGKVTEDGFKDWIELNSFRWRT